MLLAGVKKKTVSSGESKLTVEREKDEVPFLPSSERKKGVKRGSHKPQTRASTKIRRKCILCLGPIGTKVTTFQNFFSPFGGDGKVKERREEPRHDQRHTTEARELGSRMAGSRKTGVIDAEHESTKNS